MVKTRSRAILVVLFWGGLWGLAEAMLGHALHLLRIPGLAGWIMFPVGFWTIRRAYRQSGRAVVLAGVPAAAAAVKLADFLLPVSDPFIVINPAAAILLEGCAVAVLFLRLKGRTPSLASLLAAAAAWRAAYSGWGIAASAFLQASNRFGLAGFNPWSYFAADSLINAALIRASFEVAKREASGKLRPRSLGWLDLMAANPALAVSAVLLAAAAEILLRRG